MSVTIRVRPIRTEADYEAALARAWKLMDAEDGPEGDELDVLATLIEAYEKKHYPIDLPDPVEAIKFRMEQQGLTRKDLEPAIGPRNRVAEVMNHKRALTLPMIHRLNTQLGIPAEVLIQPSLTKVDRGSGWAAAAKRSGTRGRGHKTHRAEKPKPQTRAGLEKA